MNHDALTPTRPLFVSASAEMGGAELSLLDLVTTLQSKGSKPVVALPKSERPKLEPALRQAGIEVHALAFPNLIRPSSPVTALKMSLEVWRSARAITRLANRINATVIHANTWKGCLLIGRQTRRVILHHRDGTLPQWAKWMLWARIDLAIGVSHFSASCLKGIIPDEKIRTIYNGIHLAPFNDLPDRESAREHLGLPRSAHIVLDVSNDVPWKRRDVFTEAVKRVARETPSVHGLLVGKSSQTRQPENGLTLTSLTYKDMPLAYAAADLLLHPADHEPFGRVIVEAMASGVPVITTPGGGPEELIRLEAKETATAGLLFPQGDTEAAANAVHTLLNDSALRASFQTAGRKRAAEFSVERCAEQLFCLHQEGA